jgi:hypothetical protein
MDPRLQRRVQRYGWELAPAAYEPLWQPQLACVQDELMACVAPPPGERPLDVASGPGRICNRHCPSVQAGLRQPAPSVHIAGAGQYHGP